MTEQELLEDCIAQAELNDILWVHIPDSRRVPSSRGMPDLFLIGKYACMWRELKTEHADLSTHQNMWKWKLLAAGQDFDIWRPSDRDGRIQEELQNLNKPKVHRY